MNDIHTMQITKSLAMSSESYGAMICIRGAEIGTMVSLKSDRKLVAGRDSTICGHVISGSKISRKHFEITYIGSLNKYLVLDCSSNGIYLKNGCRLQKGQEYYLSPMEELQLGDKSTIYKLR